MAEAEFRRACAWCPSPGVSGNLTLPFACWLLCHCLLCSCSLIGDEAPTTKGRRASLPVVYRARVVSIPQLSSGPEEPTTVVIMMGAGASEELNPQGRLRRNKKPKHQQELGVKLVLRLLPSSMPASAAFWLLQTQSPAQTLPGSSW